jgi:phosphodiesterase/alkaline phosphatase D-like protein
LCENYIPTMLVLMISFGSRIMRSLNFFLAFFLLSINVVAEKTYLQPLTLATVRGVEAHKSPDHIKLWGRGDKWHKSAWQKAREFFTWAQPEQRYSFGVVQIKEKEMAEWECDWHIFQLKPENDFTHLYEIANLSPGTEYDYRFGYFISPDEDINDINPNWVQATTGYFKTDTAGDEQEFSFILGSCRLYFQLFGQTLFGSAEGGDHIFGSIRDQVENPGTYGIGGIDFMLEIGDQLYYDPRGSFMRTKTKKDMRKLYQKVRGYPNISWLTQTLKIYSMCDDHDIHRDNTNEDIRMADLEVFRNGKKVFMEYQSIYGPEHTEHLYYDFNNKHASFFVFDTRSERESGSEDGIPRIVSEEQMAAFDQWIDAADDTRVLFIVTPTPCLSQPNVDSWWGYPAQQAHLIDKILAKTSDTGRRIPILTGDAHCARSAVYKVLDSDGAEIGQIPEILSSGLCAVNHDKGKPFNIDDDSKDDFNAAVYDQNNSFPYMVDNSQNGGYQLQTFFATPCYPERLQPDGFINYLRFPFSRVIDDHFTQITVSGARVTSKIYNQDNVLRNETNYDLTGEMIEKG